MHATCESGKASVIIGLVRCGVGCRVGMESQVEWELERVCNKVQLGVH